VEFAELKFFGNVLYDLISQPIQDLTPDIIHTSECERETCLAWVK